MSGSAETVWAIVLIKDFGSAKERLSAALPSGERRDLARRNAELALAAAGAASHVLAVCGGLEAAELARLAGVEVLLEARPAGQNPAARLGIDFARQRGAAAVLLLSSDLPLIRHGDIAELLAQARTLGEPAVLAAPATGRAGTNALYLCPPDAIDLHFGDESLPKFQAEADRRGLAFALFESPALALDLDEPADLAQLAEPRFRESVDPGESRFVGPQRENRGPGAPDGDSAPRTGGSAPQGA